MLTGPTDTKGVHQAGERPVVGGGSGRSLRRRKYSHLPLCDCSDISQDEDAPRASAELTAGVKTYVRAVESFVRAEARGEGVLRRKPQTTEELLRLILAEVKTIRCNTQSSNDILRGMVSCSLRPSCVSVALTVAGWPARRRD